MAIQGVRTASGINLLVEVSVFLPHRKNNYTSQASFRMAFQEEEAYYHHDSLLSCPNLNSIREALFVLERSTAASGRINRSGKWWPLRRMAACWNEDWPITINNHDTKGGWI